ncbi:MAG TPA: Uma2 family endonuclease [Planctomycetaceae bacterium]|nr:Uma2 family endonuclease [Planctomycetaceae bacterium]
MKLTEPPLEIEYPESDGKPMGETDVHRSWLFRLIDMLAYRHRGQQVYVSGDLLVYYEEGRPQKFVVPDVFAVKDCDPRQRRIFKTWEEGRVPSVIFELTSESTRREDAVFKPKTYARLRVPEYFLYDPTGEYLNPPLRGFRLIDDGYCPIEPDASGALVCEQLNVLLRLESGQLCLFDRTTGDRLLTEGEAERAAREREQRAREAEQRVREQEHAARLAAEAEVERLRKLLEQRQDPS